MTNLFACLVHENPDSVGDLVRNLSHLDPDSTILLYDGGRDPGLLQRRFDMDGPQPIVHPAPTPQQWGRLHGFAIDCMRFALTKIGFDTLTVVDSDQLLLRPGYSAHLARFLAVHPEAGMLGSAPGSQPRTTRAPAAISAWREHDRWRSLCRRFPNGEAAFPQWTFWPTTVFSAAACRDLVRSFDEDEQLRRIMAGSRIFATEEIVLPTLVALHGHEIVRNPCSHDFVRYGVLFTPRQLAVGMDQPDVFWAHPIPRPYEHPLRRTIRARHGDYRRAPTQGAAMTDAPSPPLLRTLPILARMRPVKGWLEDDEADLLIAAVARALAELPEDTAVVEVGSYCGRSTTVIGSVVKLLRPSGRVYAIDPHEGEVGAHDRGISHTSPTLAEFRRNMTMAQLDTVVETLQQYSWDVRWERPIGFVLIDGLHDYENVKRDFSHFEPHLVEGGYVAFHDYAHYWPGVIAYVDELLATGRYDRVDLAASMILLRRRAADATARRARLEVCEPEPADVVRTAAVPEPERIPAAPVARAAGPLVSCVMPTYDRRALVPTAIAGFLRQDRPDAELLVVDDGPKSLADLIPDDPRVRHLRLDRRLSIGAKRNLGCDAARGALIANWDDDDWYAPWRLSCEIAALEESGADVVGLNHLLYLEPAARRAWRYAWPPHGRPWLHDAVLLFTRDLWRRNPFPDTSRGIDCRFLWSPVRKRIKAIPDERFYVGIIHSTNTSPKNTRHGLWSPHPMQAIEALMGDGASLVAAPS
jgi:predicted O-methyltransferase YrrM